MSEFKVTGLDPYSDQGIELTITDGLIKSVTSCLAPDNGYLSVGLVDLQVNGYAGLDFNGAELSTEKVIQLCEHLLKEGVTSFLPTLITASKESMCQAMATIALATKQSEIACDMIAGLHIEGPAISLQDGSRGAHPKEHVRPPSLEEFTQWQDAAAGMIKLVTLAPEQPGSSDYISSLTEKGVVCAIGHTAAAPNEIDAAIKAGASMSTHLGNAVLAQLPRHPNLIWSQLGSDELTASFIADGHHLRAEVFRSMIKAKGLAKSILVSDTVSLAGMPAGSYNQAIGGDVLVEESGRISMAGTNFLAGASCALSVNVCRAMDMAGLMLAQVLPLVTSNPGRLIGINCKLEKGAVADIIRFELPSNLAAGKLKISEVILAGKQR